jgi:hypothetical protein
LALRGVGTFIDCKLIESLVSSAAYEVRDIQHIQSIEPHVTISASRTLSEKEN